MTGKINEHGIAPSEIKIYRHSSDTARSPNDAGGKVPVSQYDTTKQPERKTR
jgi:hypothetical protein